MTNTMRVHHSSARRTCRELVVSLVIGLLLTTSIPGAEAVTELLPEFINIKHTDDLPAMRQRKVVRALVTASKTDFFLVNGQPYGLAFELLREYEKYLNQDIKREEQKTRVMFVPVTFDQLLPALVEGKGDFAAAMLTVTPERQKHVAFATTGALKVNELVVSHTAVGRPKRLEDLAGKRLYVLRSSSYAEHLRLLNTRFMQKKLAPMRIEEADSHLLTEDILELVNAGVVDLTVADDYKARLWAHVFPNIVVHEHLKISEGNTLGAAVRQNNSELQRHFTTFLHKAKKGTLLGNVLFKRYFENVKWIKNPISDEERKKLQQYIALFKKYGA